MPAASAATAAPERSPIPAFHGTGTNWRIDLQADGGLRHTARLQRAGVWTNATLVLRSATPESDPTRFVFDGTLFAAQDDTPMRVEIDRAECSGRNAAEHPDTVRVEVHGSALLEGCGQITPY